jgi:glycine/D-amino acid oxidase-like deaminating enzyme
MHEQGSIAVIGAGVVGSAVAYALARENRPVVLIDRAEPGTGGASYGNAGHIAAELSVPLPSLQLLFTFWRELFAWGGPLDIPVRHVPSFMPWAARFAAAALRRRDNTAHLAPLVKPSSATLARWLEEMGHPELLRRNGHYEIWLHAHAERSAHAQAQAMQRLAVPTAPAPRELIEAARVAAGAATASGLWFPDSAHVLDPLKIVQTFVAGAAARGAHFRRAEVHALQASASGIEVIAGEQSMTADSAVVCAGAWSAALLAPHGLSVPLESVRGYHIELPQQAPLIDAPVLYANEHIVVTPMAGRLRASSYMEFRSPGAPADRRKPARLRKRMRALGYGCAPDGPSWVGARPVLPDYLPGIGRAPGAVPIFYAIGHQHLGLTMAAGSAELVADLVAQRQPRQPVAAFDLRRF